MPEGLAVRRKGGAGGTTFLGHSVVRGEEKGRVPRQTLLGLP